MTAAKKLLNSPYFFWALLALPSIQMILTLLADGGGRRRTARAVARDSGRVRRFGHIPADNCDEPVPLADDIFQISHCSMAVAATSVYRRSRFFLLLGPPCVLLRGLGQSSGGVGGTHDPDYPHRMGGALHLYSDGGYVKRDNDASNGMAALEAVAARRLSGGNSGHGALAYCGARTRASDILRAAWGAGILPSLVDADEQEVRRGIASAR